MKKLKIFNIYKPVIGVIHIDALPGTPKYKGDVKNIISKAIKEASVYMDSGVNAIIIENMHDVPYLNKTAGHEISTVMSIIGYEVKNRTALPCGIQILAGANIQAIAAAHSAGLDFIRSEGFVFSHIADEGEFQSDAGELLRYRKQIGAENILIFADVKKKHSSHTITKDLSVSETAKAAEFFLSDGVIVTGKATGTETNVDDVKSIKAAISVPVIIGSGITADNISNYHAFADAFIVGSYFKKGGLWSNGVDAVRVKKLMRVINGLN